MDEEEGRPPAYHDVNIFPERGFGQRGEPIRPTSLAERPDLESQSPTSEAVKEPVSVAAFFVAGRFNVLFGGDPSEDDQLMVLSSFVEAAERELARRIDRAVHQRQSRRDGGQE